MFVRSCGCCNLELSTVEAAAVGTRLQAMDSHHQGEVAVSRGTHHKGEEPVNTGRITQRHSK